MRYHHKAALDALAALEPAVYEVREVTEPVGETIETRWGPVLIGEGGYIVTAPDGTRYGTTADDLEHLYAPAEEFTFLHEALAALRQRLGGA